MSRWPPSQPTQRDRSPPRFASDRRPSATYSGPPAQSNYRPSNDQSQPNAPPRGPKADNTRAGHHQFTPTQRGRGGFQGRSDVWDRDRDARDTRPPLTNTYRREDDWPRRDRDFGSADRGALNNRENRGYVGRIRSASPPRPPRNDSKDAPYGNFSRPSEGSSYAPSNNPGSIRARGRGGTDWDRSRGRNSFVAERDRGDLFSPRSRSRDGRDAPRGKVRDRERESDRGDRYDRREMDRSREREIRSRDYDGWSRDRSPGRSDSGTYGQSVLTPTPAGNASNDNSYSGERNVQRTGSDFGRRQSALLTPTNLPKDGRKEEGSDYLGSKLDTSRRDGGSSRAFSPPSLPDPSASAGLDYGPPPSTASTAPVVDRTAATKPVAPKAESTNAVLPSLTSPSSRTAGKAPLTQPATIMDQQQGPTPTDPAPRATAIVSKEEGLSSSLIALPPQAERTVAAVRAEKPEIPTPTQTPFQPPTGPKADRISINSQLSSARTSPLDPWSKVEPHRALRPSPAPASTSLDQTHRRPEPPNDPRNIPAAALERAVPPAIPLGPRSGSRPGLSDANTPQTPPIAPKAASRPVSAEYRPGIPTGPRSGNVQAMGGRSTTVPWISPDYKPASAPRPPSIMSGMNNRPYYDNRDRQPFGPNSQRLGPYPAQASRPRIMPPSIMNRTNDVFEPEHRKGSESILASSANVHDQQRLHQDKLDALDPDVSMNASSEDDDALDEDDFQDSEDKFQKEMKSLETKKPLPLLKDPVIVTQLIKIQMLSMIANNTIPAEFEGKSDIAADTADLIATGLPSPDRQLEDFRNGRDSAQSIFVPLVGRKLKDPPINPIPTPPIEDLPYLAKDAQPPITIFEDPDDEIGDVMTMLLQRHIESDAWAFGDIVKADKEFYEEKFEQWRDTVSALDLKRELKASTPAPASPALSVAPSVTPLLTHERTRGGKNATDLDFQNAIRISEQSAREEEERRAREKSKPNLETEAEVPAMYQPAEVLIRDFEDTNQLITEPFILDKFDLIPPEDDFNEEEQTIFIDNFVLYPKKWGKIAEALPDRTYQQCIAHYYLTKEKAGYKERFRKAQPKRRRGRAPNSQLRSNALLTETLYAEDTENPPMTDSGRPKRAAAPVFGDVSTDQDTTPAPTSTKRIHSGSKDSNGEQGPVKSTRGRKAGMGTKTRRTKAQIAEDTARAQMQANGNENSPLRADGSRLERAKPVSRGMLKPDHSQGLEFQRPVEMNGANTQLMPTSDFHPTAIANTASQVTSYWSVPETQKFPSLIAYFGRDYAAIADFMKTKSVTMIKNQYQRQIQEGKKDLEEVAMAAEEKRARGESMGSPPTPVAPPKRRYEATPSMASAPRPIASAQETVPPKAEPVSTLNPSIISDFPPNSVHRNPRGEIIPKPRILRESTNLSPATLLPQQRVEEEPVPDRFTLQPTRQVQSTAPPRGFFHQETRQELRPAHAHHTQDQSPPHRPSRAIDLTQPEVSHRASHQNVLPPARESVPQYQPVVNLSQSHFASSDGITPAVRQSHSGHSRQASASGTTSQQHVHDHLQDYRRQEQPHRGLYVVGSASSPVLAPSQPELPRIDHARPNSTPVVPPDPPRPTPAKRSNLMSILNDDPPEQPAKRPSIEAVRSGPISSPTTYGSREQRPLFQQTRERMSVENMGGMRGQHTYDSPHSHAPSTMHQAVPQVAPADYGSPGSAHFGADNKWLLRHDPRLQTSNNESAAHQSPAPAPQTSQYSVAPPPNTQVGTLPNIQRVHNMDMPPRTHDRTVDHRSMLGRIGGPGHMPSPPPQQHMQLAPQSSSHQPGQPYRSASNSSHGRGSSINYNTQHGLAQQQQMQPPHSHSHSASSTPVSALHSHRSHSSLNYEPRHNLPQHQQQQQQAQQQHQNFGITDQDRRRDYEIQQRMIRSQQEIYQQQQQQQQQQHHHHHHQEDQLRQREHQSARNSYPGLGAGPGAAQSPMHRFATPPNPNQHGNGLGIGAGGGGGLYGAPRAEVIGPGQQGQGHQVVGGGHYRGQSQGGSGEERR